MTVGVGTTVGDGVGWVGGWSLWFSLGLASFVGSRFPPTRERRGEMGTTVREGVGLLWLGFLGGLPEVGFRKFTVVVVSPTAGGCYARTLATVEFARVMSSVGHAVHVAVGSALEQAGLLFANWIC